MVTENCIIAVDTSGSVSGSTHYYQLISQLISKLKKRNYKQIIVISWSTEGIVIDLENFCDSYVKNRKGDGGTQPSVFCYELRKLLPGKQIRDFDLIITTDGEIGQSDTDVYVNDMIDLLSTGKSKLNSVEVYFFGHENHMNTNLIHAFDTYQMFINSVDLITVAKEDAALYDIETEPLFIDFKLDQLDQLVTKVMTEYSLVYKSEKTVKTFRNYANKINEKFLASVKGSFDENEFSRLLKNPVQNHDRLCQMYRQLLESQRFEKDASAIQRLYNMFNVNNFKLTLFTAKTAAVDWINYEDSTKKADDNDGNEGEDEAMDTGEPEKIDEYCPILFIQSNHIVLVIHKPETPDQLLHGDHSFEKLRSQFAKCPLKMFEYFDSDQLNQQTMPSHLSAEAFSKLYNSRNAGGATFQSHYNLEAYGLMLYNFEDNSAVEQITAPDRSQIDNDILQHNARSLNHLFYGDFKVMGGAKGLLVITALYAIYQTKRIGEEKPFIKKCLRDTILRLAHLFKCNLALFSGLMPTLQVKIIDTFKCVTLIVPDLYQGGDNGVRRLGSSAQQFLSMMHEVFGLEFKHQHQLAKFDCWRFMMEYVNKEGEKRDRQLDRLSAICQTRQQNWCPVAKDLVMLLEGENRSGKAFNSYLDSLSADEIFKLFAIMKSTKQPLIFQNLEQPPPEAVEYQIPVVSEIILSDNGVEHVKICRSTCRPTLRCCVTKQHWLECVPEPLRKRYDFSFFAHFFQFVDKYKKQPELNDLLLFINRKYPTTVYYGNMVEILSRILLKFKTFFEENLNLSIEEYLKNYAIGFHSPKREMLESQCSCKAHSH